VELCLAEPTSGTRTDGYKIMNADHLARRYLDLQAKVDVRYGLMHKARAQDIDLYSHKNEHAVSSGIGSTNR
jgi:hypothetical protein